MLARWLFPPQPPHLALPLEVVQRVQLLDGWLAGRRRLLGRERGEGEVAAELVGEEPRDLTLLAHRQADGGRWEEQTQQEVVCQCG